MRYRKDIDGLRSIAVLPVVFYHIYFGSKIPGGFVGVDIFFVISGFLISNIINTEFVERRFSLFEFYRRRVLRIFPAIFAMYFACLLVGLFVYFPSEQASLRNTVLSSVFFVSNILFYKTSGYFAEASETNPLLHTWSLSVEEQFYIFFPLILFAIVRFGSKARFAVMVAIAVASLIAAEIAVRKDPNGAFYLVQYRAWELMVGGLLAIGKPALPQRRIVSEAIGIGGLLLILASIFLLNEDMPFPGLTALPPCLGAAALLYSGRNGDTLVARLLSTPIPRFFGLISYSLYLWHWPVFVFAEHVDIFERAGFLEDFRFRAYVYGLILISVSILLATLSWHFVEKPFRMMRHVPTRSVLWNGIGGMVAVAFVCTAIPLLTTTFSSEEMVRAEKYLAFQHYGKNHPEIMGGGTCFLTSSFNDLSFYKKEECLENVSADKPNYLVIGDSHAAHLVEGLSKEIPEINFLQATASGCKPILKAKGQKRCLDLINFIFLEYLPEHGFDGIIISADWAKGEESQAVETARYLRQFSRAPVLISGPVYEFRKALPRLLAEAVMEGDDLQDYARSWLDEAPIEVEKVFETKAMPEGTVYFSVQKALEHSECRALVYDGVPRQFDYGHFTGAGSECLADQMRPVLLSH